MESRLRRLLLLLESVDAVALVHPYIDSFDADYFCLNDAEIQDAVHGKTAQSNSSVFNRKQTDREGRTIYTRTFYIGLFLKPGPGKQQ